MNPDDIITPRDWDQWPKGNLGQSKTKAMQKMLANKSERLNVRGLTPSPVLCTCKHSFLVTGCTCSATPVPYRNRTKGY